MLYLGVGSDIGLLTNPSTTQPAFAVIVSVIRGESEGNTTCKLKVKPLITKCLSVGYIMIRFQFGGVLHEADFDVGFAAPTNPVELILFVFFPEFDPKH